MLFTKKTQAGRYGKKGKASRDKPTLNVPEAALQKQMNDTLNAYGIKWLRITDQFWSWFNAMYKAGKCPDSVYFPFCDTFKDMPDNVCIVSVGDKYNVCAQFELKSLKGKTSKGQKKWAKEHNVQELRSTEENENAVKDFVAFIKKITELIEKEG